MMAIFMAFQAPEIEVIGFTTIFGNVSTELATINALHLVSIICLLVFIFVSFVLVVLLKVFSMISQLFL